MINVGIVDDHTLFLKAMADQLNKHDGIDVIMQATNGKQMLEYLQVIEPDVILLDLDMPEMDGIEATEKLRESYQEIKIIILSMHDTRNMVLKMVEAGVNGYLVKDSEPEDVVKCLREIVDRDFYFNDRVSEILREKYVNSRGLLNPNKNPLFELSEKEVEVIKMICNEYTNQEIAESLHLTKRSIETYRGRIMHKIGCKNVVGIVKFAIANEIIIP